MQAKLKLLIVDDHPVFRRGLREIIEEHRTFQIVGEASDGKTALDLLGELKPDVIVLDIDMPRLNGLEMARSLQRDKSAIRIVFLTMYKDEDLFNAAMVGEILHHRSNAATSSRRPPAGQLASVVRHRSAGTGQPTPRVRLRARRHHAPTKSRLGRAWSWVSTPPPALARTPQ